MKTSYDEKISTFEENEKKLKVEIDSLHCCETREETKFACHYCSRLGHTSSTCPINKSHHTHTFKVQQIWVEKKVDRVVHIDLHIDKPKTTWVPKS